MTDALVRRLRKNAALGKKTADEAMGVVEPAFLPAAIVEFECELERLTGEDAKLEKVKARLIKIAPADRIDWSKTPSLKIRQYAKSTICTYLWEVSEIGGLFGEESWSEIKDFGVYLPSSIARAFIESGRWQSKS